MRSSSLLLLFVGLSVFIASCDSYTVMHTVPESDFGCAGMGTKGTVPIDVYKLDDDHCYPAGIFANPTPPDQCDHNHYHYPLLAIDGYVRPDDGTPCGAASEEQKVLKGSYLMTAEEIEEWNKNWKTTSESSFVLENE